MKFRFQSLYILTITFQTNISKINLHGVLALDLFLIAGETESSITANVDGDKFGAECNDVVNTEQCAQKEAWEVGAEAQARAR